MNDTAMMVLVILSILFSLFSLTFSLKILIESGKLEREAIRRGYATYNQEGDFTWK